MKTKVKAERALTARHKRGRDINRDRFFRDELPYAIHGQGGLIPPAMALDRTKEDVDGVFGIRAWPLAWFDIAAAALCAGRRISLPVPPVMVAQASAFLVRGLRLWQRSNKRNEPQQAVCIYDSESEHLIVYAIDDHVPESDEEE